MQFESCHEILSATKIQHMLFGGKGDYHYNMTNSSLNEVLSQGKSVLAPSSLRADYHW